MSNSRTAFEEIDPPLRDAGGAMAIFTRRKGSNVHTVSFFKEFERDGEKARSTFFSEKAMESLKRLLPLAEKRLTELNGSPA